MKMKILLNGKILILTLLLLSFSVMVNAIDINSVLDLWNVRNNLGGTYDLLGDLELESTNQATIASYQNNTDYVVGNIVRYNNYAHYCTNDHNSGTAFISDNWVQMWEADKGWQPIGNSSGPFYGKFNGNNHVIKNLFINRKASPVANNLYPTDGEDFVGLFGLVSNGPSAEKGAGTNYDVYIKDLGIENPNVSGRRATGSLVGRVFLPYTNPERSHIAYIENCYAKADGVSGSATVSGFGSTGGLVGANNSDRKLRIPVIRFSYADVDVSATHPNNNVVNPLDVIEQAYYNPYNIKYGGLVGCNENGTTQDSYALGNVSGGDRVGGLAGCSIGGAIFRSYATGTVTRNITPGNYLGGKGGIVGVSSGYLPPALGGTNAYGSVEDAYWDTTTSGISTSAGGIGMPTGNFSNQSNFNNWDFTNIWQIAGTYPTLKNSPIINFHFRTSETGNYSSASIWSYSSDLSSWTSAVTYPDLANAISISIQNNHTVNIYENWYISSTTIESGGKLVINSADTLFIENSSGDDLIIAGNLDINGNLVLGQSASMRGDTGSQVSFLGNDIIAYTSGVSSLYDVVVNNPNGVSFSEALTINGSLTETNGYLSNSASTSIKSLSSSQVRYLNISDNTLPLLNFSASTSLTGFYPSYIKRAWNLEGQVNSSTESDRQRQVTFYWNASEDGEYDWTASGNQPILYAGINPISPDNYDVSSDPRQATYTLTFDQSAKASKAPYQIGLEDNETLPVTLSAFTAEIQQDEMVQISWTTQSESNVIGYTVLRNNQENLEEAAAIEFLESENSLETNTYIFIDDSIQQNGNYYYWLKTSEYDGTSHLYGPIQIQVNFNQTDDSFVIPLTQGISSIYPNPFNPTTKIEYYLTQDNDVAIEIYNVKGQRVNSVNLGRKAKGKHSFVWNASDKSNQTLSSGVYFTKVSIGKDSYFQKMILMK